MTGGCDAVGSVFGRMFAMPPRETNYFTPNNKFYVVNYSDSPFNVSRDLRQDEWKLTVKGEVKKPLTLGWRDLSEPRQLRTSLHAHVHRHLAGW